MVEAVRTATWSAALFLVLAGCLSTEPVDAPADQGPPAPGDVGNVTRFLAIGDQGTGGPEQFQVAAAMEAVCAARGCDFVLALGDNIYELGALDEYDPQFDEKFEAPYANFSIPFYMVQGNHDNSYDPIAQMTPWGGTGIGHWYATGNAEVAYHYREDRASDKWQMPARYYHANEGLVDIFALDTNLLMWYGTGVPDLGELPDFPAPGEQAAWLRAALAESTAPWRISIGHHPYLSNGQHGNAGAYDGMPRLPGGLPNMAPLAGAYVQSFYEDDVCPHVDLVLAGHDHDMQWLAPVGACGEGGVDFIVSGAAGKERSPGNPDRNEAYFQQYETYGFAWLEFTDSEWTAAFYDADGNILYEGTRGISQTPKPAAVPDPVRQA